MVNKRILMSLLVLGVIIGLASAGTFAYFSDSQTTNNNVITAGTLKLNTDIANQGFTVSNIQPTSIATSMGTFSVTNSGSLPGVLTANISSVSGGVATTGGTAMNTALVIDVKAQDGTYKTIYNNGTLTDATLSTNFANSATFTEDVRYTYFKTAAQQNQGDTFTFKVQYQLRQV